MAHMLAAQGSDDLGFSFNPIKAVKKVGKAVGKGAVAVGKGAAKGAVATTKFAAKNAGTIAKVAVAPAAYLAVQSTKLVGNIALAPVKSKIRSLTTRRARKLAWDRRKSKTPTVAENQEARNWTKASLSSKGPHGKLLATLAGAPVLSAIHLGVAPALTAAAVPVLLAIVNQLLQQANKSGAAPATLPSDTPTPPPAQEKYVAQEEVAEEEAPVEDYAAEDAVAQEEVAEEAMANGYFGSPEPSGTALYVSIAVGLGIVGAGLYGTFRHR